MTSFILFIICSPPPEVEAANGQAYINGANGVLTSHAEIPDGLKNLNDLFTSPAISNTAGTFNTGAIFEPGQTIEDTSNPTKQAVVRLTQYGSANAYGVVWSKRDQSDPTNRNYIDVDKKQSVSMWLFMGGGPSISQNQNTGDGMAFVLQNDSASAHNNNKKDTSDTGKTSGIGGESLGVWGQPIDSAGYVNASSVLAQRAIQNSWAIEFDTNINSTNLDGGNNITNNFDKGVYAMNNSNSLNHIATGFPADNATYTQDSTDAWLMTHSNLIQRRDDSTKLNFLTDGQWHHLTVVWLPANTSTNKTNNPEITFSYDDKNIDGSAKTGTTRTVPIVERSILGNALNNPFNFKDVSAKGNKLYWGFTGSTADLNHTENNLVIMESIPSIAEGHVTSTVHDNTQKRDVATTYDDTYTGDKPTLSDQDLSVNNNDKLSIKYNLYYDSGLKQWSDIAANINLPAHINYTDATISYNNSNTPDETIALSGDQTTIAHTLTKALDSTNNTSATISVNGTAVAGDSTSTTVDPATAKFDSPNIFKSIDTPSFKIIQPKTLTLTGLSSNTDNQSIKLTDSVSFGGTVAYKPTDTIDTSKIKIHRIINGVENPVDAPALGSLDQNSSADVFNYTTSATALKSGTNTISFYAEDEYHNESNKITYTVNVIGDLIVNANKSSSFDNVQSFPKKRVIHRSNNWDVNVTDNRSKDSTWTLQAESTPLTSDNGTWNNGGIVFVDDNKNRLPITNENVNIAHGTKTLNGQQIFNISSSWTKDNGILLDQTNFEPKGTYTTKITWTAVDDLQNIA